MLLDKLKRRVEALNLDLRGKVVLTEAATGPYVVTPIIAALAGAKVYAFSRETRYGTTTEVFEQTRSVYQNYQDTSLDITFMDTLTPETIAKADIITNSGHLRPLNKEMLQHAKDTVVIPMMYEAWEWREADMDIDYIKERGFKLGATNERHPEVDVFNYLGDMAVKQIMDAGLCLYKNKFILLCNNDFGPYIAKVVAKMCEKLGVIDKPENRFKYQIENLEWLSDFPEVRIPATFKDAEAVIFTAYPFDATWVGIDTAVSLASIKEGLRDPLLLRYAGHVDTEALDLAGIRYYPAQVPCGHMGVLPSAVGYDPIIRLQAGGLKVGEVLHSGNYTFNKIPILELACEQIETY
ncbi:hypothetical protein CLV24_12642 [Pontibacter ummariensis]|uniref:Uncharacterized protein n=1 Tax=Pontibacter ummariensis TaxID=1610492 RepID=A0A239K528_9BACT|nr:hypothetical protein [Pontibacter ummariensis]PRY06776.1 hypothetical protein CLV24_12642 [Pontibacter ummariensis]SNT12888.1 hypothetical protein SAMN06296052_12611 [Pontibacter ummariensis]